VIDTKFWVILTQPNCPYCDKAKDILRDMGINEFTAFDITEMPALKYFLVQQGLYTVPQVYKSGYRIGGYDDLKLYFGDNYDGA